MGSTDAARLTIWGDTCFDCVGVTAWKKASASDPRSTQYVYELAIISVAEPLSLEQALSRLPHRGSRFAIIYPTEG
jgi:hypothetical protein